MTEAQLQSVFKRHGLVPVNPLNEKFNPNFHEALFQQVSKQRGYSFIDPMRNCAQKQETKLKNND